MGVFEIEGAGYWDDPWKNTVRVLSNFAPQGRFGMFLDAPASVDLTMVERIPMLFLYATTMREAAVYDPSSLGVLVCMRLEDRTLSVDRLLDPPGVDGLYDDPPPRDDEPGTGTVAMTDQINLLRVPAMQRPGTCLLTGIVLDRVTNRVLVKVSEPHRGFTDDAVPAFLEKLRRPAPAPERMRYTPGQTAARFQPNLYSPALPPGPGLALDCERVVLFERGAHAWLRGAVRLPVLAREVVPPPVEVGPDAYGEPRPVAIVGVWLVMIGTREARPQTVLLRVPVFAAAPVSAGETVTGYFEYDLFGHPAVAGIAQTTFIYAFAGDLMAGPARFAVVTEEMLQEGGAA